MRDVVAQSVRAYEKPANAAHDRLAIDTPIDPERHDTRASGAPRDAPLSHIAVMCCASQQANSDALAVLAAPCGDSVDECGAHGSVGSSAGHWMPARAIWSCSCCAQVSVIRSSPVAATTPSPSWPGPWPTSPSGLIELDSQM